MLSTLLPTLCATKKTADVISLASWGLPHWSVRRYRTGREVLDAWPESQRTDDFWVSREVLAYLTEHPQGVETEAVVLEDTRDFSKVLLSVQSFSFSAAGQVSDGVKGETSGYDFRRRLLAPFAFRVLSLGQFLTSGDWACDGLKQLTTAEATRLLPAVAEALMRSDRSYSAYLIKDLYPADHPVVDELEKREHYALPSDPAMQLEIPANWSGMDDYLETLSSKYRVRYRRARGKLEGISRRSLSATEVLEYRDEIYDLYRQVSSGAAFNAASVRSDYFPWLAQLGHHYKGYFDITGELVGFTTAIANGDTLHAHFLGLREDCKRSHHLYHNMLYDLLETGIEGGLRRLDYGRTALEIKSSVGATAREYAVLVRARYGWLNRLIPIFTPAVYGAPAWTARSPFRK